MLRTISPTGAVLQQQASSPPPPPPRHHGGPHISSTDIPPVSSTAVAGSAAREPVCDPEPIRKQAPPLPLNSSKPPPLAGNDLLLQLSPEDEDGIDSVSPLRPSSGSISSYSGSDGDITPVRCPHVSVYLTRWADLNGCRRLPAL